MVQNNFNNFDNKEKLPNEQAVMILGLISYAGCCCTSGFLGIVFSGIGLYLAKKSEDLYNSNPERYILGSLNTWKIINLIGLILSILTVIYYIYMKVTGKDIEQQEKLMEILKNFQKGQ